MQCAGSIFEPLESITYDLPICRRADAAVARTSALSSRNAFVNEGAAALAGSPIAPEAPVTQVRTYAFSLLSVAIKDGTAGLPISLFRVKCGSQW